MDLISVKYDVSKVFDLIDLIHAAENNVNINDLTPMLSISELRKIYKVETEENLSTGKLLVIAKIYGSLFPEEERDYIKAFNIYTKLAQSGNLIAIYELGYCYENGLGTNVDLKEAMKLYEKAANENYPKALNALGNLYGEGKGVEINHEKAYNYFSKSFDLGNINGQYMVGMYYYQGLYVSKDEKKAVQLFNECAKLGHTDSENILGCCYEHGTGIKKDLKMAAFMYEKAAKKDDIYGVYNLARLYYLADKIQEAISWCKKGIELGDKESESLLGHIYFYAKKQFNLAYKCFSNSKDVWQSEYHLAMMYEEGLSVKQDHKKAYELYLRLYDKMPKNIELAETEETKNAINKDYANIIKKVQMYENNKCNNCGALFSFVDKRFLFKTFKVCSKCGKKK